MGRWRPPQPQSSPYITPAGYSRLHKEQQTLWEKRAEVTEAVSAAAAEGDRSENAEYIYRKKQLREIDLRIRYLQKRLPTLKVVDQVGSAGTIRFGAYLELERDDGEVVEYQIVGADEIDASGGKISIDSPLAKSLLGKSVDDEVSIAIKAESTRYTVISIDYRNVR